MLPSAPTSTIEQHRSDPLVHTHATACPHRRDVCTTHCSTRLRLHSVVVDPIAVFRCQPRLDLGPLLLLLLAHLLARRRVPMHGTVVVGDEVVVAINFREARLPARARVSLNTSYTPRLGAHGKPARGEGAGCENVGAEARERSALEHARRDRSLYGHAVTPPSPGSAAAIRPAATGRFAAAPHQPCLPSHRRKRQPAQRPAGAARGRLSNPAAFRCPWRCRRPGSSGGSAAPCCRPCRAGTSRSSTRCPSAPPASTA